MLNKLILWNKHSMVIIYYTFCILVNFVCKHFVEDFCIYIFSEVDANFTFLYFLPCFDIKMFTFYYLNSLYLLIYSLKYLLNFLMNSACPEVFLREKFFFAIVAISLLETGILILPISLCVILLII